MAFGTEPFTDGYGDYKQPTVIDYDKRINTSMTSPYSSTQEEKEKVLKQFQIDQENTLQEILSINPLYAGEVYKYLVFVKDSKLAWDIDKIDELKSDVNWLYNLSRYLRKRKDSLITT